MSQLKEITVFTIGNATELKAWSNVPYFFTKNLEDKNIKINRVDIEEDQRMNLLYRFSFFSLIKLFYKNSNHNFFRTRLNYFFTNIKIKKAIKQYSNSDAFMFLTFSFSAKKYTTTKIILFSDWSYLYYINTLLKREPYWFEKETLKREKQNIESADLVINLFPQALAFNKNHYNNTYQYYLGNVINNNSIINTDEIFKRKLVSKKLLFIGTRKYLKDVKDLIKAFKILYPENNTLELHIIGLTEKEVNTEARSVFYYGYLDKGIREQNELYYSLLSEAKAIINTNSNWGAFSAMTEAIYYYTPVITAPYNEFMEIYGNSISFGYYVTNSSEQELILKLKTILSISENDYIAMMNAAHEKVKDLTWENYSEKFLKLLQQSSN